MHSVESLCFARFYDSRVVGDYFVDCFDSRPCSSILGKNPPKSRSAGKFELRPVDWSGFSKICRPSRRGFGPDQSAQAPPESSTSVSLEQIALLANLSSVALIIIMSLLPVSPQIVRVGYRQKPHGCYPEPRPVTTERTPMVTIHNLLLVPCPAMIKKMPK